VRYTCRSQIDGRTTETTSREEITKDSMSIWGVFGVGGGQSYQGEVCISAGTFVSGAGPVGASLWSMPKSSIIFAGFERKASIPAFKHSCFVDS